MPTTTQRLERYRSQSARLLEAAHSELRQGRWSRSEELLWGSLTLAVKAVALSRGDELADEAAARDYAQRLGQERRDRRLRNAFSQLESLPDAAERIRQSRLRLDYLVPLLDEVTGAVETLWQMVPPPPGGAPGLERRR